MHFKLIPNGSYQGFRGPGDREDRLSAKVARAVNGINRDDG